MKLFIVHMMKEHYYYPCDSDRPRDYNKYSSIDEVFKTADEAKFRIEQLINQETGFPKSDHIKSFPKNVYRKEDYNRYGYYVRIVWDDGNLLSDKDHESYMLEYSICEKELA